MQRIQPIKYACSIYIYNTILYHLYDVQYLMYIYYKYIIIILLFAYKFNATHDNN